MKWWRGRDSSGSLLHYDSLGATLRRFRRKEHIESIEYDFKRAHPERAENQKCLATTGPTTLSFSYARFASREGQSRTYLPDHLGVLEHRNITLVGVSRTRCSVFPFFLKGGKPEPPPRLWHLAADVAAALAPSDERNLRPGMTLTTRQSKQVTIAVSAGCERFGPPEICVNTQAHRSRSP